MEFKIGDTIKLKNYGDYSDHRNHKGETAILIEKNSETDNLGYRIKWEDENESNTNKNNLLPDKVTDWRKRIEGSV